ncbi:MAG: PAS domain S-box protein, partial [Pseudomonadota bacterium]
LAQVGAADSDGNVFAGAALEPGLGNVRNRNFFRRAFSTLGFSGGNYHVSPSLNKPLINYGLPVPGPDMKISAVLFASLDLGRLSDDLARVMDFGYVSAALLDAQGVVLAQGKGDPAWVGKKYPIPEVQQRLGRDGADYFEVSRPDGEKHIYAMAGIGLDESIPLATLVISLPTREAFALSRHLWLVNLVAIFLVGVLALTAAWFAGGPALVRPVNSIMEAVKKITKGELSARVGALDGTDGLGELANALDQMAQTLEGYYSRLNKEIQDRKETERELIRNQDLLDRTQQISLTASWEKNLLTNECRWSNQQFRLFGYAPGEASPSHELFQDHIHPDDRPRVSRAMDWAIERGEEIALEYRYIRKDGRVRYARSIAQVEKNLEGRPERIRGAFQDVTETKLILEALKESEETANVLLNAPADSAILVDSSGTILAVNNAAAAWVGLSPERMTGLGFPEFPFGLDPTVFHDHLVKIIASRDPLRFEMDFEGRVYEYGLFPVFDSAGEVDRVAIFIRDVTEKAKAFDTAAKLAAIASSSDDAIIGKNTDGIIQTWNRGAELMYGYKAHEIIGRSMAALIPPDRANELADIMSLIKQGKKLTRYETERLNKNGDRLVVSMTISPVRDRSGQVVAAASVSRDVTEQKKKDRELREREKQYRVLFEDNHSVMLLIDPVEARIADANAAACRYYGYPKSELISFPVDKINTLPLEKIRAAMAEAKNNRSASFQFKHRLASGEVRDVEVFSGPIVSEGRELLYSIVHDITARKWSEEELLRVNRALSTLSACNKTLVYAPDEAALLGEICRNLVSLGGHFFAWIGLVDRDDPTVIRVAARAGFEAGYLEAINLALDKDEAGFMPLQNVIATGTPFIVNDLSKHPDPAPWARTALDRGFNAVLSLPLKTKSQVIGAINILSDSVKAFNDREQDFLKELAGDASYGIMTRRLEEAHKKADKERRRLERRLRQAQKMEAIGTLAGGIAHDFNNILGAVIGFSQVALMDAPLGSQLAQDLEQILKAGNRAAELVKHILAFSRQTETEKELMEPGPIIKEALKLMRASLPSTIEIKTNIKAEGCRALIDPTQVHQIVMNLCTNAAHAMVKKGGLLEVSLLGVDPEREAIPPDLPAAAYLKLVVRDTGSGMKPATIEKIFDPYFTTKAPGQGTGLGLSVVQNIVQASGGTITVESRPEQGSTFTVFLPMTQSAAPKIPVPVVEISRGEDRILFVDDEPALVELSVKSLERLGYKVTARTDSLEALELFMSQPYDFDLVMTDQTMPKLVGLDLAARILKIRPDLPIILCTGFGADFTEETVLAAGLKGLALKPLLMEDAARKIREALDKPPRRAG